MTYQPTTQLIIRQTWTRSTQEPQEHNFTDARMAREFAYIAGTKGYHVKWTEIYEAGRINTDTGAFLPEHVFN